MRGFANHPLAKRGLSECKSEDVWVMTWLILVRHDGHFELKTGFSGQIRCKLAPTSGPYLALEYKKPVDTFSPSSFKASIPPHLQQ